MFLVFQIVYVTWNQNWSEKVLFGGDFVFWVHLNKDPIKYSIKIIWNFSLNWELINRALFVKNSAVIYSPIVIWRMKLTECWELSVYVSGSSFGYCMLEILSFHVRASYEEFWSWFTEWVTSLLKKRTDAW